MNERIKKAVIPAGGRGTRFLPMSRACAKELLPIIDRPVLDYIIDEVCDSGITELLIIISPEKENIKTYYTDGGLLDALKRAGNDEALARLEQRLSRLSISFVTQKSANGSGDALMLAEDFSGGEPFAVLLGDDVVYSPDNPVAAQLISAYNLVQTTIVGMQERLTDDIYKYGVGEFAANEGNVRKMLGIMEKPEFGSKLPSRWCSLGRYVFTAEIFDALRQTPLAKNGELQLTDGINLLCKAGRAHACNFSGRRYDLGDKLGSLEAIIEYGLRRPEFKDRLKEFIKNVKD